MHIAHKTKTLSQKPKVIKPVHTRDDNYNDDAKDSSKNHSKYEQIAESRQQL